MWLQKLRSIEDDNFKKLRNEHLKLLLFALHRRSMVGIFENKPPDELESFHDGLTLMEMTRELIELTEKKAAKDLAPGECPLPAVRTSISADLKEYTAAQMIPKFGAHVYYAVSCEPIQFWKKSGNTSYPGSGDIPNPQQWENVFAKLSDHVLEQQAAVDAAIELAKAIEKGEASEDDLNPDIDFSKKIEVKGCDPIVFKWKKDSNLNLHQTYEIYSEGDIDNIEKQGRHQLELDEEAFSILDTSLPGRQRIVIRDPYYRDVPHDLAERRMHGVVEEIPEPIEEEDEDEEEPCPCDNVCATPSSPASSPCPCPSNDNRTGSTTGYSPSSPLACSLLSPTSSSRLPAPQSSSSRQPTTRSLRTPESSRSVCTPRKSQTPDQISLRTGRSPASSIRNCYSPAEQSYSPQQMEYSVPNSYGGSQIDFDTSNMYPMQPSVGKVNRPYSSSSSRNNAPSQEPCCQFEQAQDPCCQFEPPPEDTCCQFEPPPEDTCCQFEPPPEDTCCQFEPPPQDTCCHPSLEQRYQYERSSASSASPPPPPPPSLEQFRQYDPNPYRNYDTNVYSNASSMQSEYVCGQPVCAQRQMPPNNYANTQGYGAQPNYDYTAAYTQDMNYNKNTKNTNSNRGYAQPEWAQMNVEADIGNNDECCPDEYDDGNDYGNDFSQNQTNYNDDDCCWS
ncbi:uncharacterized protein LOC142332295 [Lycorma delicatula]|uniref:uncharacterized protein LOC142332295 n=1 Tax=Lycorma delicatula TaxID=130591 RepID=UPI003F5191D1